jgi:anti-sigma B factor antagonist
MHRPWSRVEIMGGNMVRVSAPVGGGETSQSPPPAEVAGSRGTKAVVERELKVEVEFTSGSADSGPRVRVSGEVDIQTSPLLDGELQKLLDQGVSSILVDLDEVTFLDSTGLSVLIAALKRCQASGGELHLVSPRSNVRRVLEITGLTDTFHVVSEDEGP